MSEWQSIETAPKNKHILCAHLGKRWIRFGICYTDVSREGRWYYSGTSERSQWSQTEGDEPTHWMPFPDPPQ